MPAADPGAGMQAARCDCQRVEHQQVLLDRASIPPRYYHCTLEDFDITPYPGAPDALGRARILAQGFVDNFPVSRTGLLFMGPCGVGKTHLAVAILSKLIQEKGVEGRFTDARELLKRIQATFDPQNPVSESDVLDPLLKADVLVLDDLGVGRATEWVQETLHYLLNQRYTHERTTLITTNFDDSPAGRQRLADGSEIERGKSLVSAIGERMRSRLYEMCRPVQMSGEDFRRRIHAPGL
ncbi:MAG: ATP-binding protein [Terriglobales bacterium]